MTNKVALVLHEEVSESDAAFFNEMPVWILETKKNRDFIKSLHHEPKTNTVITTFPRNDGESNSALTERIIYTLDDHHNENSFGDVYDTLIVSGLMLEDANKSAFSDVGFVEFEETDFGFIARKLKFTAHVK